MNKALCVKYRKLLLLMAICIMAIVAIIWLGYEFWRLLWQPDQIAGYKVWPGAIDFEQFYTFVKMWFSGMPLYGEIISASYPPASYVILWPFLGWLSHDRAFFLWVGTTVAVLIGLIYLVVRISGAVTRIERLLIVLIPLSMYATGAIIGNGQVTIHVLATIFVGIFLLGKENTGLKEEMATAVMILFALLKPSITIPFFWMVLFVPRNIRPAMFVLCGYIFITFLAILFQENGIIALLQDWVQSAQYNASSASIMGLSHNNLNNWLAMLGLEEWYPLAAILLLLILGLWIYRNRNNDIWILAGVTAFISRFWTYHAWYDDLLILLPIVALFRIVKGISPMPGNPCVAILLLGLTLLTTIAPGGHYLFPPPWNQLFVTWQAIIWIFVLCFLIKKGSGIK